MVITSSVVVIVMSVVMSIVMSVVVGMSTVIVMSSVIIVSAVVIASLEVVVIVVSLLHPDDVTAETFLVIVSGRVRPVEVLPGAVCGRCRHRHCKTYEAEDQNKLNFQHCGFTEMKLKYIYF